MFEDLVEKKFEDLDEMVVVQKNEGEVGVVKRTGMIGKQKEETLVNIGGQVVEADEVPGDVVELGEAVNHLAKRTIE